jgi:hypothetical protein
MKIYTASFFEPEVHGLGRKISICSSKPKNLSEEQGYDCLIQHEWLSPEQIYWDYINAKKVAGKNEELAKKAGQDFVANYLKRLDEFKTDLEKQSEESGKSIFDLIGLEDGDTLLSWERGGKLTFRTHAAEFLRSLGYEVEER